MKMQISNSKNILTSKVFYIKRKHFFKFGCPFKHPVEIVDILKL